MKIAALILAAGASTRMGSPKALLDWQGETVLFRLERLFARHAERVIVAVGDDPRVTSRIGEAVRNPMPDRGMLSSLQCGLRVVERTADAVIFLPVDYPAIDQSTVAALVAAFEERPSAAFAIPRHQGRRGHPILMARRMIPEVLALTGSEQARDVIRARRGETAYVDVADEAILLDMDTPAEYEALVQRWAGSRGGRSQ